MSEETPTIERIRSFIVHTFPAARKRALQDDHPLLESGIVDSLGMLDVVAFLEKSFGIQVSDEELTPDNFANVGALTSFILKKQARVEVTAE
jgi:acyl carrier protein